MERLICGEVRALAHQVEVLSSKIACMNVAAPRRGLARHQTMLIIRICDDA